MNEKIAKLIELATQEIEKKYPGEPPFVDVEDFIVQFDDCCMIIGIDNGNMKLNIIEEEIIKIDHVSGLFENTYK